jgi:FkbM family methyltransferase
MLIKYDELCKKYSLDVKGILHVGAHKCEELNSYMNIGCPKNKIVWIEGNKDLVEYNKNVDKDIVIFNYLISDVDDQECQFNISNNGESSSIFELGTHKKEHPHIKYVDKQILKTQRIDTIYKNEKLDPQFANFLNIDIQGAELLALKSMGELLNNFDYLYLEVNKNHLYVGCCLVDDIDEYVKQYNFHRIETKWTPHGWGDGFYVKKSLESL